MTTAPADLLTAAFEHHRAGNLPLAEELYRQHLSAHPRHAQALNLLGALCIQANRPAEAVELIQRAVVIEPGNSDYYNHLGSAYGMLNEHERAVASLEQAVQLAPQSAAAHYNLGTALRNQGNLTAAVGSFRQALQLEPDRAEAQYNLANTLRELKRPDEAEAAYRAALAVRPNYGKALINLGTLLREATRFDEAIDVLNRAVEAAPNNANAHFNLATVLRDAGHYEPAVQWAKRAIEVDPQKAEAYSCLGTLAQALGRWDEAGAYYDSALECDPELPDAHYCRALHRMRSGDVAGGLQEFEWRWKSKSYSSLPVAEPRWQGESLAGRTILLRAEQGLGDTLHFVRYAAPVKARGGRVMLECPQPLHKVLASCPGLDELVATGAKPPPHEVYCPLMSLPTVLDMTSESTFWNGSYLSADAALVDAWQKRLEAAPGFRVGICWQGNSNFMFDAQRSFALEHFAPLARIPGVRLVSLQKGAGADQLQQANFEVVDFGTELDEAAGPFMDTAALMRGLDLVITTDTAIGHLAGALGVPVWVAISTHGDWRWFIDRAETPWYPSMRLFRQRELNNWAPVFAEIADELRSFVTNLQP